MDILKYAAAVEVLEPPELRARVRQRIATMQALYAEN
jgi:predicted DNA-binding transcriptional regulator YafY